MKPALIKREAVLVGEVSRLTGDTSLIWGYASARLSGDASGNYGDISGIFGELSSDLTGYVSGVYGDVTGLSGEIGVFGDVTGLSGNLSGLVGYVTGLFGDLASCEISEDEKSSGVDVSRLFVGRMDAVEPVEQVAPVDVGAMI